MPRLGVRISLFAFDPDLYYTFGIESERGVVQGFLHSDLTP